jgi:hypothetical protein
MERKISMRISIQRLGPAMQLDKLCFIAFPPVWHQNQSRKTSKVHRPKKGSETFLAWGAGDSGRMKQDAEKPASIISSRTLDYVGTCLAAVHHIYLARREGRKKGNQPKEALAWKSRSTGDAGKCRTFL